MGYIDQSQLIVDVTQHFIMQVAPQEQQIFVSISEEYLKDPDKILKQQTGKEELLGFGPAEAATTFLTPIVLSILTSLLASFVEKATEPARIRTWSSIKKIFKKFGGDNQEEKKLVPPLTPEQTLQLHKLCVDEALRFKLSAALAKQLADALIGRMALANAEQNKQKYFQTPGAQ